MEATEAERLDHLFGALSDSTRRRILELLVESDKTVTELAESLGKSVALTSKHAAALTRSGLISRQNSGRVRWCRLEPDAIRRAAIWLEGFGQFNPESLDRLEWLLGEDADLAEFMD
ncbi:MAG: winged helix-turn-helix transcriptional regulator [Rhodobacteraceae bacterium]|nr:winged helix-turn-helix transcriptional regulator [Paracoccaceae bacterium]